MHLLWTLLAISLGVVFAEFGFHERAGRLVDLPFNAPSERPGRPPRGRREYLIELHNIL